MTAESLFQRYPLVLLLISVALLILRQLFYIEDSLQELHQATHSRISALREAVSVLSTALAAAAKR